MAKKEEVQVRPPRRRAKHTAGPLYPKGTPLDDNGAPLENVEISLEDAESIGALDTIGARTMQQTRSMRAAKSRGEPVVFNGDDFVKFDEILELHSDARVIIEQIAPKDASKTVSRSIASLRTYDALQAYVRGALWDKRSATTFHWRAMAPGRPMIAGGDIEFAEQEINDMSHGHGGGPPNGFNPYAYGFPPNPYAQQQQYGAQPAPQAPPQPVQPQIVIGPDGQQWLVHDGHLLPASAQQVHYFAQQPAPAPAPMPVAQAAPVQGDVVSQLLGALRESQAQVATLQEELRRFMGGQSAPRPIPLVNGQLPYGFVPLQQPQPQPQQQAQPVPEPAKPPDPTQQLKDTMNTAIQIHEMGQRFAARISPPAPDPPEPAAPVVEEDTFPIQTKEINGVTVAAVDGEPMLETSQILAVNAPKIITMFTGFADKLLDRLDPKKRQDEAMAHKQKEIELQERAAKASVQATEAKEKAERARVEIAAQAVQTRLVNAQLDAAGVATVDQIVAQGPPAPVAEEPPPAPPPNGAVD